MSEIILSVAGIVIPAVFAWLGTKINEFLNDKVKKDVVIEVVNYVEQTCSKLTSTEKYEKALEKSAEWIQEKGLNVSNVELEILIESAVKNLTNEIKKGE